MAEIENAIARTDLVEERQASVWGGVLGILSSAGMSREQLNVHLELKSESRLDSQTCQ